MTRAEYYTAPSDHVFEEIKTKSILIWKTYEDEQDKVVRIERIINFKDNAGYIVAMFDCHNQDLLLSRVRHPDTIKYLTELLEWAGGDQGG